MAKQKINKIVVEGKEGVRLVNKVRRVKVFTPVCPDCGEFLEGNNSMISPYNCPTCNVMWVNSWTEPFLYTKKLYEQTETTK